VDVIHSWGEDSLCRDISIVAGGSLLNSAVHGANYSSYRQADIQINTFGVVGCDIQGGICMKALQQHPLIINKVIEKSEYTTGTCIVLSGKQDRLFVTSRGMSANCLCDLFSYY
jgi:sugar/nucleoside kinase (ribokinase family)